MRILFLLIYFFISFIASGKDFYFTEIKFNGLQNFSDEYVLNRLDSESKIDSRSFFNKLVHIRIFDDIKVYVSDKNVLNILI